MFRYINNLNPQRIATDYFYYLDAVDSLQVIFGLNRSNAELAITHWLTDNYPSYGFLGRYWH